jgi:hypothetical protein
LVSSHLRVHNDATDDLKRIQTVDPAGFNRLVALIQQLRGDEALISKLLEHGYGDRSDEPVSINKWIDVQKRERLPVWRLKAWDLEREGLHYRLIYCFNWRDQSYNIMAVVARGDLDYDEPTHPIRQRVVRRVRNEFPDA